MGLAMGGKLCHIAPMSSPLTSYRSEHGLSLQALADRFGVNKTTVHYWETEQVPSTRVVEIEKATGIPRHELRPDLYEGAA
jgi:DNA-binding XRE family transcriptional regulator